MGYHVVIYALGALYAATRAMQDVYQDLAETGSSERSWENMVSWRAFNEVVGLDERLNAEDHFTKVKGPASDIQGRLRVKVKGIVKPVSTMQ